MQKTGGTQYATIFEPVGLSEEAIVHQAMGILRLRIKKTKALENEYYSSDELNKVNQENCVDPYCIKL